MNIIFVGLASCYAPGMAYQDNVLCDQVLADGHHVTYISAPISYHNGVLVDVSPENIVLPNGLHLIRLPYVELGPDIVTKKVRAFRGVYDILEREQPDVIFSHNLQYWSVLDVIRYKKDHPQVKLYADTHSAAYNSGTNWLSLHILHRLYYRYLTQKALPYLERYFYIGEGEREFSARNYNIPEAQMEYYPLGGVLLSDEEYAAARAKRRAELGLAENDRLYIHSGKLQTVKRTDELLSAFSAVDDPHAVLAVIGSIPKEREAVLLPLIEADKRIRYLGWRTGEELQEYLCAADLYCHPGGVSSSVQTAICCRCPMMLSPSYSEYVTHYDYGEVFWVKAKPDMEQVFRVLREAPARLAEMRAAAQRCAAEVLDYRRLAARLYE